MKLYAYVLIIFINLMFLNALLAIGDYVLSALSVIFRADWDISYLTIVCIYSVPIMLGFIAVFINGKLIQYFKSLNAQMLVSTLCIVLGLCGMFVSVMIPLRVAQIGIFIVARVLYVCGFYPMAVKIDFIMSECYRYYTGFKSIHDDTWLLPISFGMISVLQTYSDYFGKMVADITLPYLSTISMQLAMGSLLSVAVLLSLCVYVNARLYNAMQNTVIVQKIDNETDAEGRPVPPPVDFDKFFKQEYSVGYLKALVLLMALNFVWTGIWNGFLLLMPAIWMDLFDMSDVLAPSYVGYGLLCSCAVGIFFAILPSSSIRTIRFFLIAYLTFFIPGALGMIFSAYYPFPLLTSLTTCTAGSLTMFIAMMLVPILFNEPDYVMVFVWLEISKGAATIILPFFFGLLFEVEKGTTAVVLLYITLSVVGVVLFILTYIMIESNRRYAASFNGTAVIDNTDSNNGSIQLPTTVRGVLALDLDTSFSESEFLPEVIDVHE